MIVKVLSIGSQSPWSDYELSPSVALAVLKDNTARLLDMEGHFFTLTASAGSLLAATLQTDSTAAAQQLAAKFQAPVGLVQDDLNVFLADLEKNGMIRKRGSENPRRARPGLVSWFLLPLLWLALNLPGTMRLRARLLLGLVFLAVRWSGIPRLIASGQRLCRSYPTQPLTAEGKRKADEVDGIVRDLAARHVVNVECKERGLVCWLLLRRLGIPAKLVIGIDLYPFASHCWCELDGVVLTDFADRCERFTPVMVYA